jgi:Phytanoyl-CoA dioxygenase (PhyH)
MTKHLPVEWTRTGTAFGLLRAIFAAPEGRVVDEVALQIDGVEVWRSAAEMHDDGRVHLNIHTHLIDNGACDIGVVASSDGETYRAVAHYEVCNDGEVGRVAREALLAHRLPFAFFGNCDAGRYAPAYADTMAWVDRPDAPARVDAMLSAGEISEVEAGMLRRFLSDGFVIFDEPLPDVMIDCANEALDRAVEQKYQGYVYGDSTRLEQMHVHFPAIRDIWLYPPVHRFLSLVFGAKSQPCQSLVYVFGSQQDAHQDTVHLTPFPSGMMCGVWIALEDVREGSGELAVYPGSHRLPRVYMHDVGCAKVRGDWREFGEKVVGSGASRPDPDLARESDARRQPAPRQIALATFGRNPQFCSRFDRLLRFFRRCRAYPRCVIHRRPAG